uniref:AKAP7_NLS domain-containing protein n=1 Tax=Steinernema glaseri TaxID=37863 RepID=A0A1I7ZF38_9BILA
MASSSASSTSGTIEGKDWTRFSWLDLEKGCVYNEKKRIWSQNSISLPPSIKDFLHASKSKIRREIEEKTDCKVIVMRDKQNRKLLITTKQSVENIFQAAKLLDPVVERSQVVKTSRPQYTHFIAFPMNTDDVQAAYNGFIEELKSLEDFQALLEHDRLFYVSGKLHLTLLMLVLKTPEEEEEAKNVLTSIMENDVQQLLTHSSRKVEIRGLDCFKDAKVEKTRVVFANVQNDTIQRLSDLIANNFAARCALAPGNRKKVTLHLTIANTLHTKKKLKVFDARKLIEKYNDYSFGEIMLNKVVIYALHGNGKDAYTSIFEKQF